MQYSYVVPPTDIDSSCMQCIQKSNTALAVPPSAKESKPKTKEKYPPKIPVTPPPPPYNSPCNPYHNHNKPITSPLYNN